jgi:peptidoglycan/xylan/chitin deacetylase (PgdA/CDA1 family)
MGHKVGMQVCVTIDMEQDCPPYLETYHGVQEGTPRLLALLDDLQIHATFFSTGEVARRYPEVIQRIVDQGHELGCHGDTHRRFGQMTPGDAESEIAQASDVLRKFSSVVSFRAPNLDFPRQYLPFLRKYGYRVDSSVGRHKPGSFFISPSFAEGLTRIPASIAPSALRLPRLIRDVILAQLRTPAVFFFHPWEFIDMTRSPIPLDCRFKTGAPALDSLRATVEFFRARGASFHRISELAAR